MLTALIEGGFLINFSKDMTIVGIGDDTCYYSFNLFPFMIIVSENV